MLRLALPAVNVLSKLDVAPRLAARLEVFTEPVDLGMDLIIIFSDMIFFHFIFRNIILFYTIFLKLLFDLFPCF